MLVNASKKIFFFFPLQNASTHGDAHVDDYMPLPIVPNVTIVPLHVSNIIDTTFQVDVEHIAS
jgi:hypothetical protein